MAEQINGAITHRMWVFAVGLVIMVFGGLIWISNNFLSLREHVEFRDTVYRDLEREARLRESSDLRNSERLDRIERLLFNGRGQQP